MRYTLRFITLVAAALALAAPAAAQTREGLMGDLIKDV